MSLFKKAMQASPAYQAAKLGAKVVKQKSTQSTPKEQTPQPAIKQAEPQPEPTAAQAQGAELVMPLKGRGDKIVAENISSEENVLVKLQGDFGQALVMTNKRLYIVKWGFQTGSTFGGKCIAYEYKNISAIESRKHMTTRLLQVLTPATQDRNLSYWGERGKGNNAIESDSAITYPKKLDTQFQKAIEVARRVTEKAHAGTSNGSGLSDVEQLEKLAELKDKGVLTDEEFQAKKKQLLGL